MPIVPMIDILTILLIFFIVHTQWKKPQSLLKIDVPGAEFMEGTPSSEQRAVLTVTGTSAISLNGRLVEMNELAAALEGREWDLVIVALDGVRGLDTAASAQLLSRRLIWISDLDFGVQAYRMCVSYFFMKPVSCQKMQRALECALEVQSTQ